MQYLSKSTTIAVAVTSLYTVKLYLVVPNLRVRPPPTGHQINLEMIHEAGKKKFIFQVHVLLCSL